MPHAKRPVTATLLYGAASLLLYALLFVYADQFVAWAEQTKEHKALFLIPVAVAFVFSYFHGAFTGHFWESLGLRAAKTSTQTGAKPSAHQPGGKASSKAGGKAATPKAVNPQRNQQGKASRNRPLAQS
jgi:hypothetical protein